MRRSNYRVLLLPLAVLACTSPTATSPDGTFRVQADGHHLTLTNRTDAPAFYFLVERGTAASILWVPCVDLSSDCPRVPAQDFVEVLYTDIFGYTASAREALVHWWFAVRGENGRLEPDSIRGLVVPF